MFITPQQSIRYKIVSKKSTLYRVCYKLAIVLLLFSAILLSMGERLGMFLLLIGCLLLTFNLFFHFFILSKVSKEEIAEETTKFYNSNPLLAQDLRKPITKEQIKFVVLIGGIFLLFTLIGIIANL